MLDACQRTSACRPRVLGIRQRSLVGGCRMGRAVELAFVLAAGLMILPSTVAAQELRWDIVPGDGATNVTGGNGVWNTSNTVWNDGTNVALAFVAGRGVSFGPAAGSPPVSYTVTLVNDGTAFAVNSFTITPGALVVMSPFSPLTGGVTAQTLDVQSGAALNMGAPLSVAGAITVNGTLTIATLTNNTLTTLGGTLNGNLTGLGGLNMTGAAANVQGSVTVVSNSTLRNIISGNLRVNGGQTVTSAALAIGGNIAVQPNGALIIGHATTVTGPTTVAGPAVLGGPVGSLTVNARLQTVLGNQGTLTLNTNGIIAGPVTNQGNAILNAGRIEGTLAANAGLVRVLGPVTVTQAITGPGAVRVEPTGTLTAQGGIVSAGALEIQGNTSNLGSVTGAVTANNTLALSGLITGTLLNRGATTVTGTEARVTQAIANNRTMTVTGSLQADAGIVNESAGVGVLPATLNVDGTLTGDVTNRATAILGGGQIIGNVLTEAGGITTVDANLRVYDGTPTALTSALTVEGASALTVLNGATLTGFVTSRRILPGNPTPAGIPTVTINSGGTIVGGLIAEDGGILTVNGAVQGTITVDADSSLGFNGVLSQGVLPATAAGPQTTLAGAITNRGTAVLAGTVTGTVSALEGGTISLSGDLVVNGTMTVSGEPAGGGTGSLVTVASTRTLTAPLTIGALGRADIDGRLIGSLSVLETGTADLDGYISGTLSVDGAVTLNGVAAQGLLVPAVSGTTQVLDDGVLTIDGNTTLGGLLSNAGEVIVTSGVTLGLGSVAMANSGEVSVVGVVDGSVAGAGSVEMTGALAGVTGNVTVGATSVFRNEIGGNLTVNNGLNTLGGALTVGGVLAVNGGTLTVSATTGAASATVGTNGTLIVTSALNAGVSNGGIVRVTGGTINGQLTNTLTAQLTTASVTGGIVNTSGVLTVTGVVGVTGGVTGAGAITVNNGAVLTTTTGVSSSGVIVIGGTVQGPVTGTVRALANSNLTLTGSITGTLDAAAVSTLGGVATSVSGLITNTGTMTVVGTLSAGSGITNRLNSILDVNGALTGGVNNAGTLQLSGSIAGAVANTRTILVDGIATIDGPIDNRGTLTVAALQRLTATEPVATGPNGTLRVLGEVRGVVTGTANSTIEVTGGLVSGTVTTAGTLNLAGRVTGAVTVSGPTTVVGPSRVGGVIQNDGAMTVNGVLTADSGVTNAGPATIVVGAGGQIAGAVTNQGAVTLEGGGTGALGNALGATVTVTGVATQTGTLANAGTVTINNGGQLTFAAGRLEGAGDTIINNGGLLVGNVTSAGTVTVVAGGRITGGLTMTADEAIIGGRIGSLVLNGADARLTGAIDTLARVTNGTLDIAAGSLGALTVDATGIVTLTGNAAVAGSVTNLGRIESATTGGDITLTVGQTFSNDAAITNTGTAGDVRIVAGTIDLGVNSVVTGNVILLGDIINSGDLRFDIDATLGGDLTTRTDSTTVVAATVGADGNDIANGGLFSVTDDNTLEDVGTFTNTGTLVVAADAAIGADALENRAGGLVTNAGTLGGPLTNMTGGTVTTTGTVDGAVDNAGLLTASGTFGGTLLNTETGTVDVTGDLSSGNVTTAGSFTIASDVTLTAGNVAVTAGALTNAGTIEGSLSSEAGAAFVSTGTVTGQVALGGVSSLEGDIGGDLTNIATGDLTLTGDLAVGGAVATGGTLQSGADVRLSVAEGLTNTGTLSLLGGLDGDLATSGAALIGGETLTGSVTVTAETLAFAGPMAVTGALVVDGGAVTADNALAVGLDVTVAQGGALGATQLDARSLAVSGEVQTTGEIRTEGAVTVLGTGSVETAGLAADRLAVGGDVVSSGDTTVAGDVTVDSSASLTSVGLQGNGLDVAGSVVATGATDIAGASVVGTDGSLTTASLTTRTLDIEGTAAVADDTAVDGDVFVGAAATLTTDGLTGEDLGTEGTVTAEGSTVLSGTLAVGTEGVLRTANLTGETFDIQGRVVVSGDTVALGSDGSLRTASALTARVAGALPEDSLRGGTIGVTEDGRLRTGTLTAVRIDTAGTVIARGAVDVEDMVQVRSGADLTAQTFAARTLIVAGEMAVAGATDIGDVLRVRSTGSVTTESATAMQTIVIGQLLVEGQLTSALENQGIAAAAAVQGDVINTADGQLTVGTRIIGDLLNDGAADIGGRITGSVENAGALTVGAGIVGALDNRGSAEVGGDISGDVVNFGTLSLRGDVTGDLTNTTGATLIFTDGIDVGGTFTNGSDLTIALDETVGATLYRQRTGTLTVDGTVDAALTVAANGIVDLAATGIVTGDVQVVSRLNARDGARIDGVLSGGGTVSLQNETVGETLTVEGMRGSGTVLAFDIDFTDALTTGATRADTILSTGQVSGDFVLSFQVHASGVPLATVADDILLVDGADGSVFTATLADGVTLPSTARTVYTLAQVESTGDLFLVDQINPAIGALAGNIALTQSLIGSLVNRPTSPFVVQLAGEREPVCGYGAWTRSSGGIAEATGQTTDDRNTFDSTVETGYAGLQFGGDFACFNGTTGGFDWLAVGASGGINTGTTTQPVLRLDPLGGGLTDTVDSVTTSDFEQLFAGVYVTGSRGPYAGDIQLRTERTEFAFTNVGVAGEALGLTDQAIDTAATTLSARLSRNFPIGEDGWSVVPTGGFSLTWTDASVLEFDDGSTLSFDSHLSQLAFVGGTVSRTQVRPSGTAALNYFATGTYYTDFSDDLSSTFRDFRDPSVTSELSSTPLEDYAEVSLGINYVQILDGDIGKQFNASARVDLRGSDVLEGYGVTTQVRWQW